MSLSVDGSQEEMPAASTSEPAAVVSDPDEMEEVDLSSLLDLQDERQARESTHANRVILKLCGCLLLVFMVWYAVSASGRRTVNGLIQNVKESRHDLEQMNGPDGVLGAYDKALEKIGSRSIDVDKASRSLGVDPSTVQEDGMDAEMKGMMGGEGRTSGERKRMVEGLAHLAGAELPKPSESVAVSAKSAVSEGAPVAEPHAEGAEGAEK